MTDTSCLINTAVGYCSRALRRYYSAPRWGFEVRWIKGCYTHRRLASGPYLTSPMPAWKTVSRPEAEIEGLASVLRTVPELFLHIGRSDK